MNTNRTIVAVVFAAGMVAATAGTGESIESSVLDVGKRGNNPISAFGRAETERHGRPAQYAPVVER